MTYEEVKKMVSECGFNITSEFHEECMEKVITSLEKQIPKKYEIINGNDCCPTCGANFGADSVRKQLLSWKMDFCKYCGQALDWSE